MIIYLLFIAILIVISYFDIRFKKIPDWLVILLGILAVLSLLYNHDVNLFTALAGAGFMFCFLFIVRIISKHGLGMGDVKLMTACGFLTGIDNGIYALFIGVLLAGIYSIAVLRSRTKELKMNLIPFAPFLSIGVTVIIMLRLFDADNILLFFEFQVG